MTKENNRKNNNELNPHVCNPQRTPLEIELQEQIAHKDKQIEVLTKENAKHCQDKEDLQCKVNSLTAECDYHKKNAQRNHYEQGANHYDHSVHKTLTIHGDTRSEHNQKIMSEFFGDHPPQEEVKPQPEPEVTEAGKQAAPTALTPEEAFAERTKAIVRQMATKNGESIETCAKGHAGAYIYYVNADCFCRAIDDMLQSDNRKYLSDYLAGSNGLEATRVCLFIGHVLNMHLINDFRLQTVDVLFAFEKYYPSKNTIKNKLSLKDITGTQKLFFETFRSLLKKKIS